MMDNTPTLTPRPPRLVLSRSPSRSPSRQHKSDDILSDLSPATTLEAFTTPNGKFRASVEAASPTERAFGIRATLASKKIQEWVDELSQWPWPASAGSAGFETPAAKQRKVSINGNGNGNTSPARNGRRASREEDEETYVGSLHAQDVIKYETRVEEIQEDMEDLDVEEIKTKVLDTFSPRSRPSSSMSTHPNMPSFFASYTRMEDFTAVVTATVLQALPRLSRLMRLMDIWSVRLTVLRKIPPLLLALDDTETALTSGWQTIKKFDYSHALAMDINDDDVLSRETFDIMRRVLQDKVTELGQELDFMLDTLEGRQDTLPESWLDRMEAIEQDYGEWVVSGDRKVREGEWARTARVRKLAEEERRRKEAEEAAAKKSIDDEKRRLEEAEAARLDELEAERRAKVDAESAEWERREDERMARLVADAAERKQLEDERLAKIAAEAAAKKQREDEKKAVEEELTVTAEAKRQRDISARGDPSVKTLEDESTGSKMIPAVIGAVAGTAVGFAAGVGLQSEGSNTATADHQDDSHSSPISQSEIAKPLDGANDTKLEIKVPKASMAMRPRTPTQAIDLETTALQDFVDHAARIGLPVTPKSHGSTVTARPEPSYNPPTPALSSPSSVIRSSTSPTKQIGSGTAEPIHDVVETRPIDLLLSDETQDEIPSAISTTSAYSSSLLAAEVGDTQPAGYFRPVLSPIKSPRHAFFGQNTPELKSNTTDADTPLPSIEVPEFDESEVSTDLIVDSDITQIDGSSTSKHDVRRSSVYVLNDFPHDLESVDHLAFTSTPASPQIHIGSSDNEHDSNRDSFVSETSTNLTGRNGSVTTSPIKNSFDDSIAFTPASEADTVQNCPEVDEQSPTAGRVGLRYRFASRSPSGSPPPPMHRPPLHLLASPSFERSREASPDPEVLPTPAEASFIHGLAISTASALPSPTKGHNSDDQIQQQISSLLESLPARIRLKEEPDTSPADTYSVRSKKPRGSLTPMYTRSQSSMSNSRSPTPFLTLAPAYARNPRPRPSNGNPDIKLYHLSRSTGEAPIKLFVRLVGEHGERVMVRVGGGWADLGEYLKEYAAHHGRRVNSGIDPDNLGKVEIQDLPPRMASSGSINSFRYSHAPSYGNGRDSPVSRPVSAMEHIRERPRSSLGVRKARKSLGPADEIAAGLKSIPSPSTPLTHSQSQSQDTTPPNNPDNSTSRLSWTPEDEASSLGLAGPRGKRKESDLSMQDKEWVEGMKDKVRQASAEKERRLKIAEKEKDKKFGEMDRIGTTKRLFPKGKDVPRRDSLGGKWRDD